MGCVSTSSRRVGQHDDNALRNSRRDIGLASLDVHLSIKFVPSSRMKTTVFMGVDEKEAHSELGPFG
jgi:hypothetical protein